MADSPRSLSDRIFEAAADGLRIAAFFSLFSGCAIQAGNLKMVSRAPEEYFSDQVTPLSDKPVEAAHCLHKVLFIPMTSPSGVMEKAWDAALDKSPQAEALMSVTVIDQYLFLFPYTRTCFKVSGIPVVFK